MKIRDIMTTDVEIAEPDDTLDDVAMMMRNLDVGAIPVVEDGELIGLVTDRDIVVRCVAEGKDPSDVAVDEIITGDLQTVDPDADVEQARRMMADKQIRRLPVVENGRLVGMLSIGDVAVKSDEDDEVGETLEDISEGVKATDQNPIERDMPPEHFEAESGGTLKKAPKSVGKRRAGVHAESERQATMEHSGRQQPSVHGRVEEQDQGMVNRKQNVGHKQGITSHATEEEVPRQNRVVPIRSEQEPAGRAQKSKTSKRKTG